MDTLARAAGRTVMLSSAPAAPKHEAVAGVALLYQHGIIDRDQLIKAIIKLRLPHTEMAKALGLGSTKELFNEFLDPTLNSVDPTPEWEPWSFEDAVVALFDHRKPAEIAKLVGKTPKAVQMFRYRMFTQGSRVNKAVYELIMEGHTPKEIAALGYNLWLAEFAYTVHQLRIYAAGHPGLRPIKIIFT